MNRDIPKLLILFIIVGIIFLCLKEVVIFNLIGLILLLFSSMMLFFKLEWLRDLLAILFTSIIIYTLVVNKFYTRGFIIFIAILSILCLVSIVDLFCQLVKKDFSPLNDIKKEKFIR